MTTEIKSLLVVFIIVALAYLLPDILGTRIDYQQTPSDADYNYWEDIRG